MNSVLAMAGAETNVGLSLTQFGHKVSAASVLPESNPLSDAILSRMHGYGVDTKFDYK